MPSEEQLRHVLDELGETWYADIIATGSEELAPSVASFCKRAAAACDEAAACLLQEREVPSLALVAPLGWLALAFPNVDSIKVGVGRWG